MKNAMASEGRKHILLVEDNAGDVLLMREAFEELNLPHSLTVATDGLQALDFIFKQGRYTEARPPDLILLDVNLPGVNGHEILIRTKSNDATRHIPVLMLTTSTNPDDIRKSYQNFANAYIPKPIQLDDFIDLVSSIDRFWYQTACVPVQ
jgi:CheY-like chemotaxis protein